MRTVPNIDAGHRVPLSSEPRAVARLHLRDAKGNERGLRETRSIVHQLNCLIRAGARFSRRGRVLRVHALGPHPEVDAAHDHLLQVSHSYINRL